MNRIRFFCILHQMLLLATVFATGNASAQSPQEELLMNVFGGLVTGNAPNQSPQEELFRSVVAESDCRQTQNNGLLCVYKVGQKLKFSIKDPGGSNEVIAFRHSDWDDDYYAVMDLGCIVVVHGAANQKKYGSQGGVFVAPKNGRVHRTLRECQIANK